MPFEDMEDLAVTLNDAEEFIGNYWPEHDVDEKGMGLLLDAYDKVKIAADAVWKLESHQTHRELKKVFGKAVDNDGRADS